MRWLRTGRQLGQAVKNVQRLRQILAVFAKHGFADVVDRMSLGRFLPSRLAAFAEQEADRTVPERLRLAFEELGPTFVKLGQLLASRSDLIPEPFIDEFKKLQDDVRPMPAEVARATIERELGKRIEEAFGWFDPEPLAAASIGQVHAARLLTGEKVVVKVQRPEIQKIIDTDVSMLAFLASLLEKYIPEAKVIGPKTIVEEFFKTLSYELDFVIEANNMKKMAENLAEFTEVVIPKVYRELSTHRVLTLEQLEGLRVNDLPGLERAGVDRKAVVNLGARAFFKSVMVDGLFHGDMHAGNLFILPGNKLGVIDFGIVGRLSQKSRDQLASMVMALLSEDYEALCYQYVELGQTTPSMDFEAFQREVRNTLAPWIGLSLAEVNVGKVLIEATKIATRYSIKVPGDWMIVFKAILTIEGMGRTLDPEFDLISTGEDLVKDLIKNQYSPQRIGKEALWVARDMIQLMQILPRQIRWAFRKWNANDFALELKIPEIQKVRDQLESNGRRAAGATISAGLFVAGAVALHAPIVEGHVVAGYPLFSVILLGCGTFFGLAALFRS